MKRLIPLFLACLPILSVAQSKKIEAYFDSLQIQDGFNGNILIKDGETTVFEKSYGFRETETNTLLTSDDSFYLASITKLYTATIIMMLVEEGKLNLDDHINQYLPDLNDDVNDNITIHHLLCHQSGLSDFYDEAEFVEGFDWINQLTAKEMYQRCQRKPHYKIGMYKYSDSNYYLLSLIIERLFGKSYDQVIQERILDPLKLEETGFFGKENKPIAQCYSLEDSTYTKEVYLNRSLIKGAAAMYSNCHDLWKFAHALSDGFFNSWTTHHKMISPYTHEIDELYFGYTWRIHMLDVPNSRNWFMESGGGPSFGIYTLLAKDYHSDKYIIILSNIGKRKKDLYFQAEDVFELMKRTD